VSAKNGKAPPPEPAAPELPEPPEPASPDAASTGPDLRIALSPAQAAVGFGVIASLILLVLRQRRRRG
jgi:hypothetical protein